MRKVIEPSISSGKPVPVSGQWWDLQQLSTAEMSSEDPLHPLEDALDPEKAGEWRAAEAGRQSIKLVFDTPQCVKQVHLEFREAQVARSQEFALFATQDGQSRREVIRQQWTFSPDGSTHEVEDFELNLNQVRTIELEIDPGRHDATAFASVSAFFLR